MPYSLRVKFPAGSPAAPITLVCETGRFTRAGQSAQFLLKTVPTGAAWYQSAVRFEWTQIASTRYDQRNGGTNPFVAQGYNSQYGAWEQGVFTYSGGTLRPADSTLLLFGGGGRTWGGNQVDALRLEDNAPAWSTVVNPAPANTPTGNVQLVTELTQRYRNLDGTPVSRHSYWQNHYIATQQKLYSFGVAAPYPTDGVGAGVDGQWEYVDRVTIPSGTWETGVVPDLPSTSSSLGPLIVKHPTTEDVYLLTETYMYRYRYSTNTWAQIGGTLPYTNVHRSSGAIDTTQGVIVCVGEGGCRTVNITDATVTAVTLSGTYASTLTASWAGAGFVYDTALDKCVMYVGDRYLYTLTRVDASNYTVDRMTLTGTAPVARDIGSWPMFSRMQYVPRLGGIVIPTHWSENVFFVKTAGLSVTVTKPTVPDVPRAFFLLADASKHLQLVPYNGRVWQMFGDHQNWDTRPPAPYNSVQDIHDGNQSICSVRVSDNNWVSELPFFIQDAAQIQGAFPDDGFVIQKGVNGDEVWFFRNGTARDGSVGATASLYGYQPPGYARQIYYGQDPSNGQWREKIMYLNLATKRWAETSTLMPMWLKSTQTWCGAYDAVGNRFICPGYTGGGGMAWAIFNGTTGQDITDYVATNTPRTYAATDGRNPRIYQHGVAHDTTNAMMYFYDRHAAKIYRHSSTGALTNPIYVTDVPNEPIDTSSGVVAACVWHDRLRAVVVLKTKLSVYLVDSGTWYTFDRPDGWYTSGGTYIPPSQTVYDPATQDLISLGGIDWGGQKPTQKVYWRLRIN